VKILVVNLCDLGDVLFSTPLVEALGGPHETHYLVDKGCAAAVAGHAGLARCWILPHQDWARRLEEPSERAAAFGEALAWAEALREQRFDEVYSLQPNLLAVTIADLVGARDIRGFGLKDGEIVLKTGGEVLMRHLRHFSDRGDDGLHAAEGYLSLLPAALRPPRARLSFSIPPSARERAENLLPGTPRAQRLAVLPGAGDASKRWGLTSWRVFLRGWQRLYPRGRVWVLGGPQDAERGRLLASWLPGVDDLTGKLTFEETAAVLRRCGVAVGGDTGPLHLATAVGTPCLGLFGPTYPQESGPLLPGSLALQAGSGRMDDLEPSAVLRALAHLQDGRTPLGLAGVQVWTGREAEGARVDAAWLATSGGAWLARQKRTDGAVPIKELAEELIGKALSGEKRLEGPALALAHAHLCLGLKVLSEENP
jgi:ADP-heptose:LPS heptosyltransferase